MRELFHKALNLYGVDIVRTRNLHDSLAKHLQNVLAAKRIDCVIDVGANTGQYGQFLRKLGYTGHIVSFEPVRSVFEQLRATAEEDGNWTCHNLALGDKEEEKELNVYSSTMFSSFLSANDYSKNIWRSLEKVTPQRVRVRRLEDVFTETVGRLGCTNFMLKLDAQGYEKYVFDGARGCLEDVVLLQSELSFIPVYDGMLPAYDVLQEFHKAGFYISGLYPINRDASMAVIEFDCVMVKREAALPPERTAISAG